MVPVSWRWDPRRWRERQQGDREVRNLSKWLEQGRRPTPVERQAQAETEQRLLGQWAKLKLKDGVLCRSIRDPGLDEEICQIVVPEV